jgi:hypothetical protein
MFSGLLFFLYINYQPQGKRAKKIPLVWLCAVTSYVSLFTIDAEQHLSTNAWETFVNWYEIALDFNLKFSVSE